MIEALKDGRIFIDHGPIQMVLDIKINEKIGKEIAFQTAKYVVEEFEKTLKYMPKLKKMRYFKETKKEYPEVLNQMIQAVERSGYEALNTLGAVAGSFSDIALKKALELGGTRVIINNGGDIALKDIEGRPFKVGIPYESNGEKKQLLLNIEDQNIHGICTSGMGGRSFTKGIATAAIVCASDAATADACATYIGNKTNVEDSNILRSLAEEIDEGTDIKGQLVTLKVGRIGEKKKYKALLNGLNVAESLYNKDIIKGAIIIIGDTIVKCPESLKVEVLK